MAKKKKTLPKDFTELLAANDLNTLKAALSQCEPNAYDRYAFNKPALSFYDIPVELMAWLLEQGADINVKDEYGRTPLHYHAQVNNTAQLAFLLAQGADIHAQDTYGNTPLHFAEYHADAACLLIEHGADIVIQSLTKYIGGHGTTIGGAIIDGGKFQWAGNPRFDRTFNQPDPSYHGVNYCEHFGVAAYIARARVVPLRNTGAALSPHSAFLLLQGLETLALRMERHCENALKVAEFLKKHPQVEWVNYPALPDSPYKNLIDRDYGGKASGLLSFGIKGGREAGTKFIDALQLFLRLVNIGDVKSLATHPATTTHRQLDDTELAAAGVSPDMVRLSVGIEHIDDLLADLAQALEAAQV